MVSRCLTVMALVLIPYVTWGRHLLQAKEELTMSGFSIPEGVNFRSSSSYFIGYDDIDGGDIDGVLHETEIKIEFQGIIKDIGIKFYRGFSGNISVNVDVSFDLGNGQYVDLGNRDWASGKLGINPQHMAAGKVFGVSGWQSAAAFAIDATQSDIGYLAQHSSFTNYLFYMAPRVSYYYRPTWAQDAVEVGMSYSRGGRPSEAIYFDGSFFNIREDHRDDSQVYKDLVSLAALIHIGVVDISLTADMGEAEKTGDVALDVSLGARTKLFEKGGCKLQLGTSAGYVSDSPLIYHGLKNEGYFFDVALVYGRDMFDFSVSYFYGAAATGDSHATSWVLILGGELRLLSLVPWFSLSPFVEAGFYANSMVVSSGEAVEASGPLLFVGVKTGTDF